MSPTSRPRKRSAARRAFGVSIVALLAIAGAAFALPRLLNNKDSPSLVTPTTSATPSVTPSATPSTDPIVTTLYRDESDAWQLSYPRAWQTSRFEGHTDIMPDGLPGPDGGDPTFFVDVWVDQTMDLAGARAGEKWTSTTLANRKAAVRKPSTHRTDYLIAWNGLACDRSKCPAPGSAVLHISMEGTNATLWDRYKARGNEMIRSLRPNLDAGFPAGMVATRGGTVRVGYDENTQALVRFLDARTSGGGAEPWLSKNAQKQYDAREGKFGLYGFGKAMDVYSSYKVTKRADADASSAKFTVEMRVFDNGAEKLVGTEMIGVGAGKNLAGETGFVVRFSTV